jgi:hypothetical protein
MATAATMRCATSSTPRRPHDDAWQADCRQNRPRPRSGQHRLSAMQPEIRIVPVTLPIANRYVEHLHRHHAPLPGGFAWFCVAAVAEGTIRGTAIAGRPTNRNNDDGQTVEVLRVAADGTPNVPSALLGACARAAKAIGAARIITYTLDSESGSSLRGAGWIREADGITSWWATGNSRPRAVNRPHMAQGKVRWSMTFRPPVGYTHTVLPDDRVEQPMLEMS